jgi:hypothetical protein
MMIDSTDALLLHPARPNAGFLLESAERRPPLDSAAPQCLIVAIIYHLQDPADAIFLDFFESAVTPVLVDAGASMLASLVTEHSPNNFPRLALREGENVYITFSGFRDLAAYHKFITEIGRNTRWRSDTYSIPP